MAALRFGVKRLSMGESVLVVVGKANILRSEITSKGKPLREALLTNAAYFPQCEVLEDTQNEGGIYLRKIKKN